MKVSATLTSILALGLLLVNYCKAWTLEVYLEEEEPMLLHFVDMQRDETQKRMVLTVSRQMHSEASCYQTQLPDLQELDSLLLRYPADGGEEKEVELLPEIQKDTRGYEDGAIYARISGGESVMIQVEPARPVLPAPQITLYDILLSIVIMGIMCLIGHLL